MTPGPSADWFDGFEPLDHAQSSRDPLSFPGYHEKLAEAFALTGDSESVTCGVAELGGAQAVAIVFNFEYMGGSMGEATGLRVLEAIELAIERHLPLLTIAATGGARMQEGMFSLVQMQAICAALNRLREAGLPHLAVARQPTIGGVWVSLVSTADVIIGESGASIAFTGSRVRGTDSDRTAFLAEGKLASGAIDVVADAGVLAEVVSRYLRVLSLAVASPAERCQVPGLLTESDGDVHRGWEAVRAARDSRRPRAAEYLADYFDGGILISGDRCNGFDPHLLCGIGVHAGRAVAYVAQTGAANTPSGFRTAIRLVKLAETLQIPILTLIDTAGAEASASAEEDGVGTAIGQMMRALAGASVPVTSLLIGEGGSGGALALAAPGNLWAVPDSYFAVLAPEGAAAILYRDPERATEAADAQRVDSRALVQFGIARPAWTETHQSSAPQPDRAQLG